MTRMRFVRWGLFFLAGYMTCMIIYKPAHIDAVNKNQEKIIANLTNILGERLVQIDRLRNAAPQ